MKHEEFSKHDCKICDQCKPPMAICKIKNCYCPTYGIPTWCPLDGDGQVLHEGDRVYCYDYVDMKPKRCYGILHKNKDYPHVSDWYITYDDGQECAVLEISLVFKA